MTPHPHTAGELHLAWPAELMAKLQKDRREASKANDKESLLHLLNDSEPCSA